MSDVETDDMLPEYDFSEAEQGKYAKYFPNGVSAVLLDEGVAKIFPDSRQINEILRALIPTMTR